MHMHIHSHSHSVYLSLSHTQTKKKKNVSQINTGKVQYVRVIYPKFMKRNKRARSHWIKMEKHAEVHCSIVASLLAAYK